MVFRGTFDLRAKTARALFSLGVTKVFADKPDLDTAERLLKESAAADPSAFKGVHRTGKYPTCSVARAIRLSKPTQALWNTRHLIGPSARNRKPAKPHRDRTNFWTGLLHCVIRAWSDLTIHTVVIVLP